MPSAEQKARLQAVLQGFSKQQLQQLANSWTTYHDDDVLPRNPLENPDLDVSVLAYPADLNESGRAIIHSAQAPGEAPTVQVVEPTTGWWTQQGAFGDRFTGVLPQTVDIETTLVSLDHAPGPPRAIGINLWRSDRNRSLDNADVLARITFGAGGVQNTFDVDWLQGIQLSLYCNALRIDFVTFNPAPDGPYTAEDQVIIGATLGIGGFSSTIPPTLTTPPTTVLQNDELDVKVPDFARKVTLLSGAIGSGAGAVTYADFQMQFVNSQGTLIYSINCGELLPDVGTTGVPIPRGSDRILVINRDSDAAARRLGLMFHLGL